MKFEFYTIEVPTTRGRNELRWAWRLHADNGKVVAHHNQGYNSKSQMVYMLFKLFSGSKQEEALRNALKGETVKVVPRGDKP